MNAGAVRLAKAILLRYTEYMHRSDGSTSSQRGQAAPRRITCGSS